MWSKLIQLFKVRENHSRVFTVLGIYVVLILVAVLIIRPYAHQFPCVVCGRVNTQPVKTLYQYKVQVVPYVREVILWYCPRHIKSAPEIVTKLPTRFDSVWGRFRIVVITGFISLVAFFFILVLLDLPLVWFYLHPALVVLAFGLGGITSDFTLTVFIVSTAILPIIVYLVWHRWIFMRKR